MSPGIGRSPSVGVQPLCCGGSRRRCGSLECSILELGAPSSPGVAPQGRRCASAASRVGCARTQPALGKPPVCVPPAHGGIPATAVFMATVCSVPPGSASAQLPHLNHYCFRIGYAGSDLNYEGDGEATTRSGRRPGNTVLGPETGSRMAQGQHAHAARAGCCSACQRVLRHPCDRRPAEWA